MSEKVWIGGRQHSEVKNPAGHYYKWWYCEGCHRIFKDSQRNIARHSHGRQRIASDEGWWHILYCPELLWDWIKLRLERWSG